MTTVEPEDRKISAMVPADVADSIEAIAKRDERSVSWVIRRALRDYVQNWRDTERQAA